MKRIVVLALVLFGLNSAAAQGCLPEGIVFNTQGQINNFRINYPNCTVIEGDVLISGYNIVNLNGLNSITSIGGSLRIECNEALSSLAGLSSLTSVGGSLFLEGNMVLPELTGLQHVTYVGGDVQFTDNPALVNLIGLSGLSSINGKLWLEDNGALVSLTGLNNIVSVAGTVRIISNASLLSLAGLDNLVSVGGNLSIGGQGHLGSLGNPVLASLTALTSLAYVGGGIEIGFNNMLPSLSGLDQISNSSMTGFSIYDNASLSECEVVSICAYLASPGSNIFISNNAAGCNSVEELEQACLTLSDGKENAGSAVVSVFPNPAEGRITVEILKDTRPVSYSMIDFSGRMVREGMLTSPRTEIDLSDIPAGVYILKADSEHSAKVLKVIRN